MHTTFKYLLVLSLAAFTGCGKKEKEVSNPFGSVPTAQKENTAKNTAMKLIFIPRQSMEQTRLGGRFLPDTLYWTNWINDPNEGPRVVQTLSGPALEVQGTQFNPENKPGTLTTVYRSYPVPADAQYVTATVIAKQIHNHWVDKIPHRHLSFIYMSFTKDKMETGINDLHIGLNKDTKTYKLKSDVPLEAQNLMIKIEADNAVTFQIFDMQVDFE